MSSDNTSKKDQEIDLYYLWKKLTGLTDNLGFIFVRSINFFIKNALIIIGLIVIGLAAGYFTGGKYRHEVMIIPNFGSSSFLYEKIKTLKIDDNSDIKSVKISPIIDVFEFISSNNNLKIAEFMSQNNVNFTTHKPGNQTEYIYKYHILTITTKVQDVDGNIVNTFLANLNRENKFLEKQQIEQKNILNRIREDSISINNINNFFAKLGTSAEGTGKELKIETYPAMDGLLTNKQNIITEISWLKSMQIEQSKIFYDVSHLSNIEESRAPRMILFPLILVSLFILLASAVKTYKNFTIKVKQN